MNIYIKKSTPYYRPILYVLKIIEKNKNLKFDFVDVVENADLIWDHSIDNTQIISYNFYNELHKNKPKLNHEIVFKSSKPASGVSDFKRCSTLDILSLKSFSLLIFKSSFNYP